MVLVELGVGDANGGVNVVVGQGRVENLVADDYTARPGGTISA